MRNMSFMLTTEQIRNRSKTVTRRLGWIFLKPGDVIMACKKCMGLRKGEKIQKLTPIRILDVNRVPLSPISKEEVTKEGFPEESPDGFIAMFMRHMKCERKQIVTRIEFEYVDKCWCCLKYVTAREVFEQTSSGTLCKTCQDELPF